MLEPALSSRWMFNSTSNLFEDYDNKAFELEDVNVGVESNSNPFNRMERPGSMMSIRSTTSRTSKTSVNCTSGRVRCPNMRLQKFFSYNEVSNQPNRQFNLSSFPRNFKSSYLKTGKRLCDCIRGHQEALVAAERWKLDWCVAADRVSWCPRTLRSRLSCTVNLFGLSRISYWDLHREKVVVLTDNSVINVTYDFIGKKITDYTRIMLADLRKIRFGNLTYPKGSMMGWAFKIYTQESLF